jgi:hypothetical protein
MSAVGKKVILRRRADRSGKAGAEFLLQETNHLAHALKREAPPAELAEDRHGYEFVPVVDAAVPLAAGRHNAPFIPPLQLTGGDSGEGDHVVGCELSLHLEPVLFQTKNEEMFGTF